MADTAETQTDTPQTETETEAQPAAEVTGDTAKTLTQDEVDKIVEARLARERKKFSDYEDLKSKAAKLAEIEADQLSEIEKAQKRAADAEAEAAELKDRIKSSSLRSALLAEAAKPDRNIVDPGAVVDFLTGSDSDLVDIDDEGTPTNVADAMDQLLAKRNYLVAAGSPKPTPSADQGARGTGGANQVTEAQLQTLTPQQIVEARSEGRLDNLLGVS